MRASSWLANAKSIHDLGGFVAVQKPGSNYDEEREERAERKLREQFNKPIPVASEFQSYYGGRMHDSWVIGIERTANLLRLRLDSIEADAFAYHLCEGLGITRRVSQWPIDLLLHDPVYVRAARYGPDGGLRFADWRQVHSTEPQGGDQFIYDWFFEQDGRIQWISEIWSRRYSRRRLSTAFYLMVDCTCATAIDHRAEAIARVYGEGGRTLWIDVFGTDETRSTFMKNWHKGTLNLHLSERMSALGLVAADFLA